MTTDELMEAVSLGAAFFDKWVPDWAKKVNTETLDMALSTWCVVAQVTGKDYAGGTWSLGIGFEQAKRLGFTGSNWWDFAILDTAWKAEINARRYTV